MILCDWQIEEQVTNGQIGVDPFDPRLIQPASLDLRLGSRFRTENGLEFETPEGRCEALPPNRMILGHTVESIRIPPYLAARLEGKSTFARQGLLVHITAGWIDPGFRGQLVLELVNVGMHQLQLTPGEPIAQICFYRMSRRPQYPYGHPDLGSHYQGQTGPTGPFERKTYVPPIAAPILQRSPGGLAQPSEEPEPKG